MRIPGRIALLTSLAAIAGFAPAVRAAEPPFRLTPSWRAYRPVMQRADSMYARGAVAAGDAYLDSLVGALRAANDRPHLVQALIRRGGGRVYRGAYTAGEPDLREALTLAAAIRDTLGEVVALRFLAYGIGERGDTRQARPLWSRMFDRARERGDHSHAGWALMGMAYCDWRDGRSATARGLYRRSIAEMQASGDVPGLLEARTGYINSLPDGSPEVAGAYRQLIDDAHRAGVSLTEGNALHNLATYELQRGDPELALDLMRRAEEAFKRTNVSTRWSAMLARGIILAQLDRNAEAAAIVEPLTVMARRTGNWRLLASGLELLAEVARDAGRVERSDSLRREAIALADSLGPGQIGDSVTGLAQSLLARGRAAEGLALLDRILPVGRTTDAAHVDVAAASTGARLLHALGRDDEALARLRRAVPQTSLSDPSGDDIVLELEFAALFRSRRQPDSVLVHMRRARQQLLGRRQRPLSFEQRERRGSGSPFFAGQYVADVLAAPSAGPAAERPARAFDDLQGFKARTLADRLARTSSASEEEQLRHPATLAQLRARVLAPGDLLLDVYEGEASSVLFAVTPGRLVRVMLPPLRELDARNSRLAELSGNAGADPEVLGTALRSAAQALLGDAAPLVADARRVWIAPDATTMRLPWAAMLRALPASRDPQVALVPSASWLAATPPRGSGAAASLLALAGTRDAKGAALPGPEREVRWLQARYQGVQTALTGRSRSAEALAPQLARFPVLHLAGHATSDDQEPWRAGIRLGPGESPDDYLRAGGIARQRLGARLVVLSACRSIGTSRRFGEGALGLTAGFLAAGSTSVIATLWPVSDATGEAFARAFYPALAEGGSVGDALRTAQARLRADKATSAVADWGAFVLVGRPDTRVSLKAR